MQIQTNQAKPMERRKPSACHYDYRKLNIRRNAYITQTKDARMFQKCVVAR